jgi:small subunit ribosomal protein S6
MRAYEMTVVLRAEMQEDSFTALIDTIKTWIESNGGQLAEVSHWGRRRLAYPINRQREGYYLVYKLNLPPAAPEELERNMRINENVLRFLITRADG